MVRGKFRLNSYTTDLHAFYPEKDENGKPNYSKPNYREKRTLNFTPVMADENNPENKAFWEASPSGSIQLGTVNQAAWEKFELGKQYYVDFTLAE